MDPRTRGRPRRLSAGFALLSAGLCLSGCTTESPTAANREGIRAVMVPAANLAAGQVKPNFNLEVILRPPGDGDGFGHVKFRQANDDATIVDLGVWVRDLAPNTHYRLQRAVHTVLDDECTSTAWLTLGLGTTPQDIVTDAAGTGREDLFRTLTTPGNAFDIHFRVVAAATPTVAVLTSDCYQFFVR